MPTKTIAISLYLPSSRRYLTRMIEEEMVPVRVHFERRPRPAGRIETNHKSVWIVRYVRTFYGVGVRQPGEWIPRSISYRLTETRRQRLARLVGGKAPPRRRYWFSEQQLGRAA